MSPLISKLRRVQASELKIRDLLDAVEHRHETVLLLRYGRESAVVMPVDEYQAFVERCRERGEPIPSEYLKDHRE